MPSTLNYIIKEVYLQNKVNSRDREKFPVFVKKYQNK